MIHPIQTWRRKLARAIASELKPPSYTVKVNTSELLETLNQIRQQLDDMTHDAAQVAKLTQRKARRDDA